jgi:hypothetical protein
MGQDYRRTRTSVSLINYHFIWCPKRRKKGLVGSIKERLTTLVHDKARELDCEMERFSTAVSEKRPKENRLTPKSPQGQAVSL